MLMMGWKQYCEHSDPASNQHDAIEHNITGQVVHAQHCRACSLHSPSISLDDVSAVSVNRIAAADPQGRRLIIKIKFSDLGSPMTIITVYDPRMSTDGRRLKIVYSSHSHLVSRIIFDSRRNTNAKISESLLRPGHCKAGVLRITHFDEQRSNQGQRRQIDYDPAASGMALLRTIEYGNSAPGGKLSESWFDSYKSEHAVCHKINFDPERSNGKVNQCTFNRQGLFAVPAC